MPVVALVTQAAPNPSAPPPGVEHDHSAGVRAYVTIHAIRRYGDRILGLQEVLDGLDDIEAVDAMVGMKVPVLEIRDWLAFYGGVAMRRGAIGVCRDGVGLVLKCGRVVTVVSRRGERRR
ncbi:hypothetical protein MKK68_01935 [Methylobacterium sp. E-016]|uniref:hypothetical protein n=1 Tax=Methylobacterium sp. E-016 TaxID=2836556 RepID=UPI001FB9FB69|nr:hypothetical protein [Methylobacterium sp. E-016]MCJ2074422.1 hypothetical protein [Methylobacterium sp. E-016]